MLKLDDGLTIKVSWQGKEIELKMLTSGQHEQFQAELAKDKNDGKHSVQVIKKFIVEAGLDPAIYDQLPMPKIQALLEALGGVKKN